MENKNKKRNKFVFMMVREHEDGSIGSRHFSSSLCEFIAIVFFAFLVFFICKLVYDGITISKLTAQVDELKNENNLLQEREESLLIENKTLSDTVSYTSSTLVQKVATEEAQNKEETENAIPKGFPLSGSASMEPTELDGKPILKFTAQMTGVKIVTSGTGVVIGIEEDAEYGNRVIIDHQNGYKSIYRNAGKVLVKVNESHEKGYPLFMVESNNKEMGYQIMKDEEYIDPSTVIEING